MRRTKIAGVAGMVLCACEAAAPGVREIDTAKPRDGANGVVRWTGGKGLNVRAEPRTDSTKVGVVPEGGQVAIACQIAGQTVLGNPVWDFVASANGYIADAYVDSGHGSWIPGVPKCGEQDEGCGELDYLGACEGDVLRWCEDDQVRTVDCGDRSRVCAWRDEDIGFDCLTDQGGGGGGDGRLSIDEIVGGVPYVVSQDYGPTTFDGGYSYCHSYTTYGGLFHCGIDIAIPDGTPLFVPEDASVVIVGSPYFEDWNRPWAEDAGELRLETAGGTQIILGHMSRIDLHEGDDVGIGEVAGLSGYANGDHVHIEVRVLDGAFASGYRTVDPMEYFGP